MSVDSMRRSAALCALAVWLVSTSAWAKPVTFQVNLQPYLDAGYFDPAADRLELRGDFNAWAADGYLLQAAGSAAAQAVTVELTPGPVAYKFVIQRGAGAIVWEDHVANRQWTVPAGGGVIPPVYFDDMAPVSNAPAPLLGADLSHVPRLESLGATYSQNGQTAPLLALARASGFNLVRLRLWHTPSEPWQGLDATIAYAHRVQNAGLDLMLDLHYSDTWANPGQQTPPSAWAGVPLPALADSVAAYTRLVITRFRTEGLALKYIQLGNEIGSGILWDSGRVGWPGSVWDTPDQWAGLTTLLQAAATAVRAAAPTAMGPEIVLHVAEGGDNARCRWFFDNVTAAGIDFDVIGLSFYPWWHGTLWDLETNLRDLGPRYGKPVMVAETAYPWTLATADATGNFVTDSTRLLTGYPATPQGQLDFLRDLRRVVETAGGLGVIYWEPAYVPVDRGPGGPYENLTLFDFGGLALPGLLFGLRLKH